MSDAKPWPRWSRWLLVGLAWQVLGLAVTLALSWPLKDFHFLVHRVILGATSTNGIALLGGGFLVVYWRFLHAPLRHPVPRSLVVMAGLAGAVVISVRTAVWAGRTFCRMDAYMVDRWHLTLVTANAMLLVSVGLACGLVFVHERMSAGLAREIRENERLERVQLETQLAAIQAKVNPHFLFNTLNTMVDLVRSDPDRAEQLVLSLSDIYRRVLTLPETSGVALAEELALVRHYLCIEKIRMGERLSYEIDVPEELQRTLVPPLAVEVLVENAVRHGLAPRKGGGCVRITATRAGSGLRIDVVDDGVGESPQGRGTGFGLLSVRQRLELFYGGGGRLTVEPRTGGGTHARLEIPVGD